MSPDLAMQQHGDHDQVPRSSKAKHMWGTCIRLAAALQWDLPDNATYMTVASQRASLHATCSDGQPCG
jgi:hypothetical protein